jgi:DUF971 family protein
MRVFQLAVVAVLILIASPATAADAPKVGDTVWAQWKPNSWYHGKLDKKADVGFHVAFDDGDEINLPPSMIAVDKAPRKTELTAGTRIVAPGDGTTSQVATVVKVDGDKVECKYEDLSDATFEIKDVRLIAVSSTPAKTAKVGDVVWAQWRPNAWFHGKVGKKADVGLHIEFDDGDTADLPVAVITVDKAPAKADVKVGAHVLATWTDGKFFPGIITEIADGKYKIKFDDGDEGENGLDELRLLNE